MWENSKIVQILLENLQLTHAREMYILVREPMTKRFFFLPRKVWVHFWNREPMVVTGSPVWLGAVGAFRSYRLPNSAGIDILSPNFLIHHFNTQNRELKVISIPEGPDRIYGPVCYQTHLQVKNPLFCQWHRRMSTAKIKKSVQKADFLNENARLF